jgi:hypothetical protein
MAWPRIVLVAAVSATISFAGVRVLQGWFSAPSSGTSPPEADTYAPLSPTNPNRPERPRAKAGGGARVELVNTRDDPPPLPPIHVSELTPFQRRILKEPRAAAWTKNAVINALAPVIRGGRVCFKGPAQEDTSLVYVVAVRSTATRVTVSVTDVRGSAGAPLSSAAIDCLKKRANGQYTADNEHPDVPELRFLDDEFEMELPAPGGSLLGPL